MFDEHGAHSPGHTKASLIYEVTGNLRAVRKGRN